MKTYIIDDDPISIHISSYVLQQAAGATGEIHSFLSAEEALQVLIQDIGNIPQVIFLDLNMPKMNGWEFLEALTPYNQQLLGKCHVYILTSSLNLADVAKSKKYEVVLSFLQKPLEINEVSALFSHLREQTSNSPK